MNVNKHELGAFNGGVSILWNVATLKVLTVGHSEVRNLFTHTHRQFDIAPQRQVIIGKDSRLAYTVETPLEVTLEHLGGTQILPSHKHIFTPSTKNTSV